MADDGSCKRTRCRWEEEKKMVLEAVVLLLAKRVRGRGLVVA